MIIGQHHAPKACAAGSDAPKNSNEESPKINSELASQGALYGEPYRPVAARPALMMSAVSSFICIKIPL